MGTRLLAASLMIMMLFTSCSFRNDEENTPSGLGRRYPDIELENADYRVAEGEYGEVIIHCSRASFYNDTGYAVFEDAEFTQEGRLEGRAGNIKLYLETHDAELSGGIYLDLEEEQLSIECTVMKWNSGDKTLTCPSDSVTVRYEDGNTITGSGLTGDLERSIFTFDSVIEGRMEEP